MTAILTGAWWLPIAYVIYSLVMFNVFEIRFLCSHCPYYAEDSRVLHCLGNHGSPKLWRYRPGPLNKLEKFMMNFLVIAVIFFVFPLAVHGYGIWFLTVHYAEYGLGTFVGLTAITGATLLAAITFLVVLKTFFCSRCINFSCPLNTVPKSVVDEYLKRNEVMKKAWEEAGWQTGR